MRGHSLIPVFEQTRQREQQQQQGSSCGGQEDGERSQSYYGQDDNRLIGRSKRYDEAYERLVHGDSPQSHDDNNNNNGAPEHENWAPIREEPRGPGKGSGSLNDDDAIKNNDGGEESSSVENQQHSSQSQQRQEPLSSSLLNHIRVQPQSTSPSSQQPQPNSINFQQPHYNTNSQQQYTNINSSQPSSSSVHQRNSQYSNYTNLNNSQHHNHHQSTNNKESTADSYSNVILQPDAIYEEHYGDAYVDKLIKYLYPSGYQSMRPRSGPWKLSIVICCLFMWLSVFIVGHCYDRGQREYNYYFDNADDAYLQEVDDDTLVMETRWCGSKLLYFSWMLSVSITMFAMSYCSIIGYIKLRDVVVANERSQPPGMMSNTGGRSDCYVMVENVDSGNMGLASGISAEREEDVTSSVGNGGGYPSYQGGSTSRRYIPSIYQSDGTPQFWGGHIYRPTQAAVAMTNR